MNFNHNYELFEWCSRLIMIFFTKVPTKLLNVHVASVGLQHITLAWEVPEKLEVEHYDIAFFQDHPDKLKNVDELLSKQKDENEFEGENKDDYPQRNSNKNTKKSVKTHNKKNANKHKEKNSMYDANNEDNFGRNSVKLISHNEAYVSYKNNKNIEGTDQKLHGIDLKFANNNITLTRTKHNNYTFTSLTPHTKYYFQVSSNLYQKHNFEKNFHVFFVFPLLKFHFLH